MILSIELSYNNNCIFNCFKTHIKKSSNTKKLFKHTLTEFKILTKRKNLEYLHYNTFNSTPQASLQCSPREVV